MIAGLAGVPRGFSAVSWISDFTSRYGYNLARWEGYPVVLAMRDLVQLTGPIGRARDSDPTARPCVSDSTASDAETPRRSGWLHEPALPGLAPPRRGVNGSYASRASMKPD